MAGQPKWRRVFDSAERKIGKPLENLVGSPRYVDVALLGRRVRGTVTDALERPSAAVLHLFNLPALRDLRRLTHQVAALTNEVRQLAAGIEELHDPMPSRKKPSPTDGPQKVTPRVSSDA
jgi:hypothetical protein